MLRRATRSPTDPTESIGTSSRSRRASDGASDLSCQLTTKVFVDSLFLPIYDVLRTKYFVTTGNSHATVFCLRDAIVVLRFNLRAGRQDRQERGLGKAGARRFAG